MTQKNLKKILLDKQIKRVDPEKMLLNKDIALLSKQLATIESNVPGFQELDIESLSFRFNKEGGNKIFKELEFKSLSI